MGFLQDIQRAWWNLVNLDSMYGTETYERLKRQAIQRDYYTGEQRSQLRVRVGQADDNIALNYTGLVVERGVSMLLGNGIDFDLPGEDDDPNYQYVDAVWKANKKDILLHKVAQFGGMHGTCYLKIIIDGIEARDQENVYLPRLIAVDPTYVTIETDPDDIETVLSYTIRYNIVMNGQETARKEVIERQYNAEINEAGQMVGSDNVSWLISNYYANASTQGRWELMYDPQVWEYEFAPMIHWQNLPQAWDVYGMPDVSDNLIDLQDRINFIASNISKIIRYHAHPKTWAKNAAFGNKASWGADEMVTVQGTDADIQNLEMQSDLASSQAYLLSLRQSFFDISRTVDITSMADRLGALTNFGLRVLFMDSLAKLATKQELYGEALTEVNHRLLVIGEVDPVDGGEVIWGDPIPQNEAEEMQYLERQMALGLISKYSAQLQLGLDPEEEAERIESEAAANTTVGEAILQAFQAGR